MPPARFVTLPKPACRSRVTALALRTPLRQWGLPFVRHAQRRGMAESGRKRTLRPSPSLDTDLTCLAQQRLKLRFAKTRVRQTDVVVSYSKLGTLEHGQSVEVRHGHLLRGREILLRLKSAGRLMASQNWIKWFDEELAKLVGDQ